LDNIVENLVALRLDHSAVRSADPRHSLVVAAEAVTDMEAPRFREAINILEAVPPSALNREHHATREAVLTWARGDLLGAREMLATSLRGLTGEGALLAGFLAHMADFYLGEAGGMLETGRLLNELHPTMSRRAAGLSDGLVSFALEECGHYSEAIALAERALSINRDDVYALHAKVHALQSLHENLAAKTAILNYSNGWGTEEPMRIHMWWHFAISLIDEGELDQVLLCYDLEVRRKRRTGAWEDMDAVALLWRLDLLGDEHLSEILAPNWRMLARAWEAYAADPSYIFNDLHAAMAFAKVENYCLFDKVVNSCRTRESPDFFHSVCQPLFSGIAAFAQRDYATAVRVMSPVLTRRQLRVGGSKMQQSIFRWTLDAADSCLRGCNPHDFLRSHVHQSQRILK
jgi:hypothetical protein